MTEKDGKYIFGTVKVGDKGQIVIPKVARDVFSIAPGDSLIVFGDIKQGIALTKCNDIVEFARSIIAAQENRDDD